MSIYFRDLIVVIEISSDKNIATTADINTPDLQIHTLDNIYSVDILTI